jgi:Ni/Co efflux regulator RcnB
MLVGSVRLKTTRTSEHEQVKEMIMKYFVAMCMLAAPLAMMSAAATPVEAGFHDHGRCHWVKKTTWRHHHKHVRFVKVCGHRHR